MKTYREFVADQKGKKMTLKEIADSWKEYKQSQDMPKQEAPSKSKVDEVKPAKPSLEVKPEEMLAPEKRPSSYEKRVNKFKMPGAKSSEELSDEEEYQPRAKRGNKITLDADDFANLLRRLSR